MSVWDRVAAFPPRLHVALIGLAGGLAAGTRGLHPTSSPVLDIVIIVLGSAAVTTFCVRTPRIVLLVTAAVATGLSSTWWSAALGIAAVVLIIPSDRGTPTPDWRTALAIAAMLQSLAQLRQLGAFGVSTAVALGVITCWSVLAWARSVGIERLWFRWFTVTLGGLTAALALLFVFGAIVARSNLTRGGHEARAALRLIDEGEIAAAIDMFDASSTHLSRAGRTLGSWWTAPSRAVPALSQHRQTAVRLARGAARSTARLRDILRTTDYEALRVSNGRIDLDAIRALRDPLDTLGNELAELKALGNRSRNRWLLPQVSGWIDKLDRDIVKREKQLKDVKQALLVAPDMLGASGPRVYFVALTTPAEARGLGGLMGNWAEVTADDGHLKLTGFGRASDLLLHAPRTPRLTKVNPEYLARYGRYIVADPDTGTIGPGAWQNVTAAPHFPWVAEAIADLFPQSGGKQLDGVFLLDVYAISTLMKLTGSVAVPTLGVDVTPDNALEYLLRDQYLVEDLGSRVDLLETLARTTIDRILGGSLPTPPKLAALMSPMARQHRLVGWVKRPAEQQVLENSNLSKNFGDDGTGDVFAYTLFNGNGNKIDSYLEGNVSYDLQVDRRSRDASGTITMTFTNTAPSSGLPDYVIGNLVDLPRGTNRMILTLFSSFRFASVTGTGADISWSAGTERGLNSASMEVIIPPGATVTVVAELSGTARPSEGYRLVIDLPPTARPLPATVLYNHRTLTPTPLADPGTFTLGA